MHHVARALLLTCLVASCTTEVADRHEDEPIDLRDNLAEQGLIDCAERQDTGYTSGSSFSITVVTVDGKPAEVDTANAYWVMQQAAAQDGVAIRIVSGFRTMSQQEYLYGCYTSCSCNSCNLAARPGYSNHQSGHALDLNTSESGVLSWLNEHGDEYGFARTVPSEAWHWEWWGGGPGGGPCGGDPECIADPNHGGCDGSVVTHCDETNHITSGDCGYFGAACSTLGGAPHCVHPYCSMELGSENGTFCREDRYVNTCNLGVLSEGDCGFYGAACSEAGGQGHCVHPYCPMNLDGAEDGTFCKDETVIGTCTLGAYTEGDCGYYGGKCSEIGGTHCVHYLCWTNLDGAEDGAFCQDDDVRGTCAAGVYAERSCAAEGLTCRDGACVDPNGAVVPGPGEEVPQPPLPTTVIATIAVGGDDGRVAPTAKGADPAEPPLPPSVDEGGCAQASASTAGTLGALLALVGARGRVRPWRRGARGDVRPAP